MVTVAAAAALKRGQWLFGRCYGGEIGVAMGFLGVWDEFLCWVFFFFFFLDKLCWGFGSSRW